jgi:hypothetical protein
MAHYPGQNTQGQYVQINKKAPKGTAYCDLSGFYVMHADLVWEKEYRGNALVKTGFLVHKDFVDIPNPSLKVKPIKIDPKPFLNARPVGPMQLLNSQDEE